MALVLKVRSTGLVTVTVTDENAAAVDGATVDLTLLDGQRQDVKGRTWPLTLTGVGGATGKYTGQVNTVSNTLTLKKGDEVEVYVRAVKGDLQVRSDSSVVVT